MYLLIDCLQTATTRGLCAPKRNVEGLSGPRSLRLSRSRFRANGLRSKRFRCSLSRSGHNWEEDFHSPRGAQFSSQCRRTPNLPVMPSSEARSSRCMTEERRDAWGDTGRGGEDSLRERLFWGAPRARITIAEVESPSRQEGDKRLIGGTRSNLISPGTESLSTTI